MKAIASPTTYEKTLTNNEDGLMVTRIRRTLTVEERAAAFEHTNKMAQDASEEERRHREEKSAKLRALRLAAGSGATPD
ncbi:hypothetical protein GAO09_11140 [Rhizobiales bacterium RZME27]|uniref:Uncharacterized protein n=1 Tax=Endobacterium cereale TaxID=2663029 RepID=A0A6A8A9L1_9HYPH|nr:hypothetical protein [Endobacterium cereale]MEB2846686.1 hypothetical protein [Endobacterium cereale]MQY46598.1 hypothetical protein [Endobacterium cereale]